MRGLSFAFALVIAATVANAARADDHPPEWKKLRALYHGRAIPRVHREVVSMHWQGRKFHVFVSAPEGKPPPGGFPVFYVTDANGTFDTAAQAAFVQSFYPEVTHVDRAIVVGIGYDTDIPFPPERAYDLSPPDPNPPADTAMMRNEAIAGTGGADHLLDFIDQMVKPAIAAKWPVDHRRQILFGHSRGGLFVLHALFTRPDDFQYFIVASPAIWWHNRFVLSEGQRFMEHFAASPSPIHVLLTTGGKELTPAFATGTGRGADGQPVRATNTAMVENASALADTLGRLSSKGLDVHYQSFPGFDHITVLPVAISAAVTFALASPPK